MTKEFKCKYCGKECKSKAGLKAHERNCKEKTEEVVKEAAKAANEEQAKVVKEADLKSGFVQEEGTQKKEEQTVEEKEINIAVFDQLCIEIIDGDARANLRAFKTKCADDQYTVREGLTLVIPHIKEGNDKAKVVYYLENGCEV